MLALRDARSAGPSRYLIGVGITVSASLISYTPEFLRLPGPVHIIVRIMDIPNAVFVWLFGLSLFEDTFKMDRWHWLACVAYCLPVALLRLFQFELFTADPTILLLIVDLIALGMMAHLAFTTLAGRGDDLMEIRRRSRFRFVVGMSITVISYALSDLLLATAFVDYVPTIKAAIVLPAVAWVAMWSLSMPSEVLIFGNRSDQIAASLSFKERQLLEKLEAEMVDREAYLDPSLTIDALAVSIGSTAHGLRSLINQQLGHRHFSAYVNAMRVEAVKRAFANPGNRDVPILTIALNSGFNSISPFNRAFKAKEGVTPSAFRQALKANTTKA